MNKPHDWEKMIKNV